MKGDDICVKCSFRSVCTICAEKSETTLSVLCTFSLPEQEVLGLSYCDGAVSVVLHRACIINFLPCVHSRGNIFSVIPMKLGQNVCLNEISDESERGLCWIKNYVTRSNLRQTLWMLLRPHFQSECLPW